MDGDNQANGRALKVVGFGCLGVLAVVAALIIFGIVIPIATSKPDYTAHAIQACRDEVRGQAGDKVEFEREQATKTSDDPQTFEVHGKAVVAGTYYTYVCRAAHLSDGEMTASLVKFEM